MFKTGFCYIALADRVPALRLRVDSDSEVAILPPQTPKCWDCRVSRSTQLLVGLYGVWVFVGGCGSHVKVRRQLLEVDFLPRRFWGPDSSCWACNSNSSHFGFFLFFVFFCHRDLVLSICGD